MVWVLLTHVAMMRTMTRTTLVLLSALVALGCDKPEPETGTVDQARFLEALPTAEDLRLDLPGDEDFDEASGGLATMEAPLVGERSNFYTFTREMTRAINRGLKALIAPIAHVVEHVPPTTLEENRAVWFGSGPEDPEHHLLVVERVADGHFEYVLLSKTKHEADAEWRPVVGGTWTPSEGRRGRGAVWVNHYNDLDPRTTGTLLALWSNDGQHRSVTVYTYQWSGDAEVEPARDQASHFEREIGGGGVFVYGIRDIDIHENDPTKPLGEDVAVISRWNADGLGRADWYATGGEVATDGYDTALISQCWDEQFDTIFEMTVVAPRNAEAQVVYADGEYEACVFENPGNPVFPDRVDFPADPDLPPEARDN